MGMEIVHTAGHVVHFPDAVLTDSDGIGILRGHLVEWQGHHATAAVRLHLHEEGDIAVCIRRTVSEHGFQDTGARGIDGFDGTQRIRRDVLILAVVGNQLEAHQHLGRSLAVIVGMSDADAAVIVIEGAVPAAGDIVPFERQRSLAMRGEDDIGPLARCQQDSLR